MDRSERIMTHFSFDLPFSSWEARNIALSLSLSRLSQTLEELDQFSTFASHQISVCQMTPPTPPRDRRGFEIAIICALPLEAECVRCVFDRCWEDEGKDYRKAQGDPNAYTTGLIGKHNVVLAHMPGMGTVSGSGVAASLRTSFPRVKLALVIGICGGVPYDTESGEEILLGDIIISQALVQYDFGKKYPEGFSERNTVGDNLGRPSLEIRSSFAQLKTFQNRKSMEKKIVTYLEGLQSQLPRANHPGPGTDRLYKPSYLHKHHRSVVGVPCDHCAQGKEKICATALRMNCEELGCEENNLVNRKRLANDQGLQPVVHFGKMGSGNTVMKSAEDRDRLAQRDGIIAFEMEGAGVWDQLPSIVIKGVCDYADSHKNKQWQSCAAATAAACMKAFLMKWTAGENFSEETPSDRLWCVPFNRLQQFIGRKDEIEMLERKLFQSSGCSRIAVLGLGGVGKSRIALELAYRTKLHRPLYSVFWVRAMDALTFEEDMYKIGMRLKIPGIETTDSYQMGKRSGIEDKKLDVKILVRQRLSHESTGPWLMIIDNADDEAIWGTDSILTECLPESPTGAILVTTRNRQVATDLVGKESVELGEMNEDEATKMLRSLLSKPETHTDLNAILIMLQKLTYLPLAIVQAAAYINKNNVSIRAYLELLCDTDENVIKLLSKNFRAEGRYPEAKNPVATTWLISFEQIQRQNHLAAECLSFISCLGETNIPRSLLPDADTKLDMTDALGLLKAYFFLKERADNDALHPLYDIHRLVRLVTQSWLKSQDMLVRWTETAIKRLAGLLPVENYQNKIQWDLFMPHAQTLYDSCIGEDLAERYVLIQKMGRWLMVDVKFEKAVKLLSSVVLWREMTMGKMDESTCDAYNDLGEALNEQGDLPRAEEYHQKALDRRRANLGMEHPSTLTSMANLASTYQDQGRWKEAEQLGLQVKDTRKMVQGVEHLDTQWSMASLASNYLNQGRWKEAEELLLQVRETVKRVLGMEHPGTLTVIANLAVIYWRQARWKEAEGLQVQVREARKRLLGMEHPSTLSSIHNLALTYWDQGRWKEAEELLMQVKETRLRVLGLEHPSTLESTASLAAAYGYQGRLKEAEELGVQLKETRKRVLGVEHPDTLTSISNLAWTLGNQGRWKEAEELGVQLKETRKRVLGVEHPDTLTSMGNLAWTLGNQGRWKEAEELSVQVTEMIKRVLGIEHPDTLRRIGNLAWTFGNQGRWKEAEELFVQVMDTTKRVLGIEHPDTLMRIGNLAWTYRNQGRWKEAEELFVQVMDTTKRVLGVEHPDTLMIIDNLASMYRNQGWWKEAEELFMEVKEARKRVLGVEHPETLTSIDDLAATYQDRRAVEGD
ncbi:hypothetical protein GJ744_006378 [Endocarpon pusillum]|uniref:Nucleoside phosphorylase domain-containing protein n=1 Tax=Endocarpon pusillum TaxID=364733 RepID=A0A8H7APA1_9EURO|nr:hypothetical protein GJ744_006378 [Endocarpon pusillum]